MLNRFFLLIVSVTFLAGAAWFGGNASDSSPWREVAPGVFRSPGPVAGYALVDGESALLIDAPHSANQIKLPGNPKVEAVVLTHPHRPVCAGIQSFLEAKVPV